MAKKKQLRIKYTSMSFYNKIRFGIFEDMRDWVNYKKKVLDEEGIELSFMMSYEDYSGKEANPFIKEMEIEDPFSIPFMDGV